MTTTRPHPESDAEHPLYPHLCINCMEDKGAAAVCPHCHYHEAELEPHPAYLKPRTMLSMKFLVGKNLGQGGFGITYLGFDTLLHKKVVIKEYFPSMLVTRDTVHNVVMVMKKDQQDIFANGIIRFLEEARNVAKFSKSLHVVNVYDFFQENGTGYMVMEFLEGGTLEQYVKQRAGRVSVAEAIRLLTPVLDALRDIHAKHVFHRDISPQNIMMTAERGAVLIDFGAARQITGEQSGSMETVLKHGYSPYESYTSSGRVGPWTDVYSCGAVLYRLIIGEFPEAPARFEKDLLKMPSTCLPGNHGLTRQQLDRLNDVALCAMAMRSQDRFQSVHELQQALQQILIAGPEPAPASVPKKRKLKAFIGILVGAALIVAGIVSYPAIVDWWFPGPVTTTPTPTPVIAAPTSPVPAQAPTIRQVVMKSQEGNIIHPLNDTYHLQPNERVTIEVEVDGPFAAIDYHVIRGAMVSQHTYMAPAARGTRDIITLKLRDSDRKVVIQKAIKIKVIESGE